MEPFPDIESLSPQELETLIASLEAEEDAVSYRRRLLHGRIDLLRKEYEQRIKTHVDHGDPLPEREPVDLERPLFEGTGEVPPEHELEPLPELDSIADEELRGMIHALEVESIVLHTNNPLKFEGLSSNGVAVVSREAIVSVPRDENVQYLRTKKSKMGHEL